MKMFTVAARVAVLASTVAALSGCGGGDGVTAPDAGDSWSVGIDTRGTLADGHVGDNPFYDDGKSGGFADGMSVDAATGRSVAISWRGTTRRVDGLVENDLAGYRIYFGNQPGNYEYVVEVADPSAESVTVPGLPEGRYYFVATAVDVLDHESGYSNVSTIVIN